MAGPLLLSFVLCLVIVDYTFYRHRGSSLLSWLWSGVAYIFGSFSVANYFSRENIFLLACVVGLGIILTRLSLTRALRAMRLNAADEAPVSPVVTDSPPGVDQVARNSLGTVFISVSRNDTGGLPHLLFERLNNRFPGRIVTDATGNDDKERGAVPGTTDSEIQSCEIVLVLIRDNETLFGVPETAGPLADQRPEIASALERGAKTIAVLLDRAQMPPADQLPGDIAGLAQCQSLRVAEETLVADVARLIKRLEKELGENEQSAIEPVLNLFRPYWLYAGAIALAVLVIWLREHGMLGF
ncbi:MAG TPA: hypothetical protein VIB79_18165 [Candidatus Binatia bacterium]|jgi:hypothetical protein